MNFIEDASAPFAATQKASMPRKLNQTPERDSDVESPREQQESQHSGQVSTYDPEADPILRIRFSG